MKNEDKEFLTIAQELANFSFLSFQNGLSSRHRHAATCRVLDFMGNSLLAYGEPVSQALLKTCKAWGGNETASIIGSKTRLPEPSAALINGTMAHAMDFDDTHLPSILHPSASIIPAALAIAQKTCVDGKKLLDAINIGTEICIRLGMGGYNESLRNSIFLNVGNMLHQFVVQ